jgi:hypothetical protein
MDVFSPKRVKSRNGPAETGESISRGRSQAWCV